MKKLIYFIAIGIVFASCSKDALKKEEGSFKANGVKYSANEDLMSASYLNNTTLDVTIHCGPNSTIAPTVRLDLTKINVAVPIPLNADGFVYYHTNSNPYFPISGEYTITSYKEGNPATRHTEGNFHFRAVNDYSPYDTIDITEGYFYVNNY